MASSLPLVRPPALPWRRLWHGLHAPVPGVPRWARVAALVVPLTVLPSSLWRIATVTLHLPITDTSMTGPDARGTLPAWMPLGLYVVLLSIASELLAFTAVGLVARWGEVVPRRVPVLGGRRVPTLAALIPATLGAVVLTALWTWTGVSLALGRDIRGRALGADFPLDPHDWQGAVALAAYVPLLAWGPLLGALTVAYARRRSSGRVGAFR
ncbi:hypothetical protein [Luteimicrobium album]|nr:hypothetical protein [Luteimicrobium album]